MRGTDELESLPVVRDGRDGDALVLPPLVHVASHAAVIHQAGVRNGEDLAGAVALGVVDSDLLQFKAALFLWIS